MYAESRLVLYCRVVELQRPVGYAAEDAGCLQLALKFAGLLPHIVQQCWK